LNLDSGDISEQCFSYASKKLKNEGFEVKHIGANDYQIKW